MHHVLLALDPHLADFLGAVLARGGEEVGVGFAERGAGLAADGAGEGSVVATVQARTSFTPAVK